LAKQCGKSVLGVECDLHRVEQGNKRHSDITANQKTKPSCQTIATMEPKEFQSCNKMRSRLECTTEINTIVHDNGMASKSSNVCDNYFNKSNTACDYTILSDKGANNRETLLSYQCTLQLSLMDGLPTTQRCCGCQAVEDSLPKHGDTNASDRILTCLIEGPPLSPTAIFLIEHLCLSTTSECVQKLDELVKRFLYPGNRSKLTL